MSIQVYNEKLHFYSFFKKIMYLYLILKFCLIKECVLICVDIVTFMLNIAEIQFSIFCPNGCL